MADTLTWRDEIRLYLLELMDHEMNCATRDDGCPKCRRVYAAYASVFKLVWYGDE